MRNWGIVITVFYAIIVLGLLVPAAAFLTGGNFSSVGEIYREWFFWIPIGIVILSEALLLFLSVDTSHKRFKPRTHILVSCSIAAILFALLTAAIIYSIPFGIYGDKLKAPLLELNYATILAWWGGLWLFWGFIFFFYLRNSSQALTRLISWLIKGSVLELLVAVPCHIIVRHREDCSAPIVTSFGIVTGIAIMLLSFGPSVLLLYKKRLDAYSNEKI